MEANLGNKPSKRSDSSNLEKRPKYLRLQPCNAYYEIILCYYNLNTPLSTGMNIWNLAPQ